MKIGLNPYVDEAGELITLLTGESWPFHGIAILTEDSVREQISQGRYHSDEEKKTFWIMNEVGAKIGIIRVFELEDPTPMFDIRISIQHRGCGYGNHAIRKLAEYVFTSYEHVIRLEGHTRADNYAMRTTFHHAGFVKEAVHRKSWPSEDGKLHDSIGYAILREDWMENKTTPIDWEDFPY
ncbi:hypothetical protein D3C74_94490 [compost metagenome]